ncbi:MAG: PP2C family protein-serine/threonine phosphatase [Planctomycetes bacterium]|nr:PP2C family protein-serine/threonine phosphatase [Planctomycetota bacterium]
MGARGDKRRRLAGSTDRRRRARLSESSDRPTEGRNREKGKEKDKEKERGTGTNLRRRHSRTGPHSTTKLRKSTGLRKAVPDGKEAAEDEERREQMEALRKDLDVASQVQVNLLPKKIPQIPNYDINAFYRPSKEVGGDYYDFLQLTNGRLAMTVADVSGKGIAGSMVMAMFRSVLRMCAAEGVRARDIMIRTNELASRDIKRGMFVTCLFTILSIEKNSLRVCSAGHNPLVLWRHASRTIHLVNPNGIAIGFDKGPIFENVIKEQKFHVEPGDRVVTYTDGVVEAMNKDEELFGDKRFYKLIKDNAEEPSGRLLNLLVEAIDQFVDGAPQSDDITILTFRRDPEDLDKAVPVDEDTD